MALTWFKRADPSSPTPQGERSDLRAPTYHFQIEDGRLILSDQEGTLHFGALGRLVEYHLGIEDADELSADTPTKVVSGGDRIKVYLHRSIPTEFRPVVLFKELAKLELIYAFQWNSFARANYAANQTMMDYAKAHLESEGLKEFTAWRAGLSPLW